MKTLIFYPARSSSPKVRVPLSKSVANRWLILKGLFPEEIEMKTLSEAVDCQILESAIHSNAREIDVGAAGTAMRFGLAYFAIQNKREVRLFGTERMHSRPIGPLVDALRSMNADIEYEMKEGYPPLIVRGKHLRGGHVDVPADMSSQFITALMLIAPATHDGIIINRTSKSVSQPYVDMTASVLRQAGVSVEDVGTRIHVHGKVSEKVLVPTEGDWSAAAAFVGWVAVNGGELKVQGLSPESVQGDKILDSWTHHLGIESHWSQGEWSLKRTQIPSNDLILDMLDFPDLAQSMILAAVGQGRSGKVTGLRTLRIKETDRIAALVDCIEMLGGNTTATGGALYWTMEGPAKDPHKTFSTYQDHRMALALAPLAGLFDLELDDTTVVEKSFPDFWKEMKKIGLELS